LWVDRIAKQVAHSASQQIVADMFEVGGDVSLNDPGVLMALFGNLFLEFEPQSHTLDEHAI
jgi:hypothetical protein